MKSIVKKGLLAVTVFGTLTLGACVSDGYYSSSSVGYSSYPYSRPYVYPSSSVSFYYSSPRYYRYGHRYGHPRYYRGGYHRYHGRHYYNRPGYRPPHSHHRPNRPGRPTHLPSHRPGGGHHHRGGRHHRR
ncbi:hypothetical protein [Microbulbifer sp. Q7]|uniref:hypothetical protein n=1 Tax=Microbulbifer sp. Q7 TaxID=1785091 RepID=UPI00082B20F8|nr:hypothetical protein [Microbulbifer sp. Q7]